MIKISIKNAYSKYHVSHDISISAAATMAQTVQWLGHELDDQGWIPRKAGFINDSKQDDNRVSSAWQQTFLEFTRLLIQFLC